MFKPDDLPAEVRYYHGLPARAAIQLPEYFPLLIIARSSEEIRIHGGHSWQPRRWLGLHVPEGDCKFTELEKLT